MHDRPRRTSAGSASRSRRWALHALGLAAAGLLHAGSSPARRTAPALAELILPQDSGPSTPCFPRGAWEAAPPSAGMRPHTVARITLHHTGPPPWYGTPPAPAYLRQIQAFHTGPERRWPDIAYHLLIDLDGDLWEGRSLAFAGDTATAYDPVGHALIAVLGDYDAQIPNARQLGTLRAVIADLRRTYGLAEDIVGAHRDYAATACPGRNLTAALTPFNESRRPPRPAL